VEGGAAAVVGEVLDRQPQAPRPGGAQHQPVAAARKGVVVEAIAEDLVVDLEVVDVDPALRDAGGAAGLEDVEGLPGEAPRQPAAHRAAAQPFVLEVAEELEVGVAADVADRVEVEAPGPLEPERAAGGRIEVPGHDLAHVGVETFPGLGDPAPEVA